MVLHSFLDAVHILNAQEPQRTLFNFEMFWKVNAILFLKYILKFLKIFQNTPKQPPPWKYEKWLEGGGCLT